MLEIVRRTAEIFDLRLGRARRGATSTTAASSTPAPTIARWRSCYEGALERWERLARAARAGRRAGRARRRSGGQAGAAAPQRQARRGAPRRPRRARSGRCARRLERRPAPTAATAARARAAAARRGAWHDLADHLAGHARSRSPTRASATPSRCAWPTCWRRKLDDSSAAVDRYAEILRAHARAARGGRGPRAAGRATGPPLPRSPSSWSRSTGGPATRQAGRRRSTRSSSRSTTATSGCGSCARWRRSTSASAASTWRSTAAAAPGWPTSSRRETLARDGGAGASRRGLHAPLVGDAARRGPSRPSDPDLQAQLWAHGRAAARGAARRRRPTPIEAWRSALAARPDDVDAFLALERLLSGAARSAELVEVLEKHLEITTDSGRAQGDGQAHRRALRGRAQAARAGGARLGDGARDRSDATSRRWTSLAQLHLAGGAFRELAEVYARKLELTAARRSERRDAAHAERAHLYDEKLGEPEQAVEQLRAVLDENAGRSPRRWTRLDRIFTARGAARRPASRSSTRAPAVESDAGGARRARLPGGALVETELSRRRGGHRRYQAHPGARRPTHAEAREALWRDRARRRLPPAGGRGAGAGAARGARLGRGRRAARAAAGGRGRRRAAGWRCWARSRASRRRSGATPSGASRPGRAR